MVKVILISIALILLCLAGIGLNWTMNDGVSMAPTLSSGDIVVTIDAWSIKPGDIVIFRNPDWEKWPEDEQIWIKRVDHEKDGKFWLLGDNTEESYDSRQIGYVKRTLIYKKAVFIIKR